MSFSPLIAWTDKGLYCQSGDFYIDPHRAVDTAVITHAHSDHARRGSRRYLCTSSSVGLLKSRLGQKIEAQGISFGERFRLGAVTVSLHPAGHILGSAQVRVESDDGEIWVASGDYKRDPDPSCEPFERVACDTFITEATFGTPKYSWKKDCSHGRDIHEWWTENARLGFNSLLFGYSLGKAQRILAELEPFAHRPIVIHESISELTECYRKEGRKLAQTRELSTIQSGGQTDGQKNSQKNNQMDDQKVGQKGEVLEGDLILAPPSILNVDTISCLGQFKTAFASGWMQKTQGKNTGYSMRDYDHGFVISDHADWNDLNRTIDETGAKRVFVQHRNGALVRHLRKKGIEAHSSDMLTPDSFQRIGGSNLRLFD